MTYTEILSITDIVEKNEKLKEYYLEDVKINDWLVDNCETQKILFKDKFETKKKGNYHNLTGPAIKYKNGSEYFWIDGTYFDDKEEWKLKSTNLLRKFKMKEIINTDT